MRAVVIKGFGGPEVLETTAEAALPVVHDNQVLIEIRAAGINPLDTRTRRGQLRLFLGAKFPIVLGNDLSGIVVATGRAVTRFQVQDEVFCFQDAGPARSWSGFARSGAYAAFAVTREDTLAAKPKSQSFQEAAATPLAALNAFQTLHRLAGVTPGDRVLINGASGGVGLFTVQIAKALGAQVTALCGRRSFDLVSQLGADRLIDYRETPIHRVDGVFDIIYDVVAGSSFGRCRRLLSDRGIFISNVATLSAILHTALFPLLHTLGARRRNAYAWVTPSGSDLAEIARLIDQGRLRTVIERVYPLERVQEAHAYSETGRVQGKLVLDLETEIRGPSLPGGG